MADLFIRTAPETVIDYSLIDGRVRSLILRGQKLYDEQDGTAIDGWREMLASFIVEQNLHVDQGKGLHAFVCRMIDDGLVPAC